MRAVTAYFVMRSQTVLMSSSLRSFHIYLYGAFLCIKESAETVVVSVRSLLFDKGEYIMKLSKKSGSHLFQVFFSQPVHLAFS